jgi:hypothetical protein|tara:strand:- start:1653 stop:1805 length:153 start_codon:yes stop_codon:yes gene_type:complete
MLKNIIELLQVVNGETERIRFAQGSHFLPNNWKKGFNLAKKIAKFDKQDL